MNAQEFRFAFHARDFAKSVSFYQNTLGMHKIGGWDRADSKGALLSAGGSSVIEIYGAPEGFALSGPPPTAIHLALRLESREAVDAFYQQLKDSGEPVSPPEDRAWGHRSFVVTDPDGVAVHLYCEV